MFNFLDGANEEFRIKEFLTEIAFMINIGDHPNILKVFGCCTTEKPIYLITDYCKYGDLLHFLYDAREVRPFKVPKSLFLLMLYICNTALLLVNANKILILDIQFILSGVTYS